GAGAPPRQVKPGLLGPPLTEVAMSSFPVRLLLLAGILPALSGPAWPGEPTQAPTAAGEPTDDRPATLTRPPARATLLPPGDFVSSRAFAPDGKTLITGSGDRLIRLWDPATGRERRRLAGHEGGVLALALSPDGGTLASGGSDQLVRLWDLRGG